MPTEGRHAEPRWDARARIVVLLRVATQPLANSAIARRLGLADTTVRGHLAALEAEGLVERLPGGGRGRADTWRWCGHNRPG